MEVSTQGSFAMSSGGPAPGPPRRGLSPPGPPLGWVGSHGGLGWVGRLVAAGCFWGGAAVAAGCFWGGAAVAAGCFWGAGALAVAAGCFFGVGAAVAAGCFLGWGGALGAAGGGGAWGRWVAGVVLGFGGESCFLEGFGCWLVGWRPSGRGGGRPMRPTGPETETAATTVPVLLRTGAGDARYAGLAFGYAVGPSSAAHFQQGVFGEDRIGQDRPPGGGIGLQAVSTLAPEPELMGRRVPIGTVSRRPLDGSAAATQTRCMPSLR